MQRWFVAAALVVSALPTVAFGQLSAGEAERCFQNPGACASGGGPPPPPAPPPAAAAARSAPAPDYTSVLEKPEPDRRKLQESLHALDKYNGPIDGNLRSEASMKAITDWQKSHGYTQVGKLTPTEAITLNNEAARAPIRRLDPSTQTAAAAPPPMSNADRLKALQAQRAAARKAAEPKAEAAMQSLVKDVKAYVAADGKGVAGEQFTDFAKWYADNKTAGRTVGDITSSTEDYGQAKAGPATTAEVKFDVKQDGKGYGQCLLFAWVEATPRKNTQAFACDDIGAVEKWKSEQGLKSDWR